MSPSKTGRSMSEKASIGDRARDVAAQAIPQARRAGTQARRAGTTAVQGVKQGTLSARGWAAPRIHGAADTVTVTAPKVSSALHRAAEQVQPAPPAKAGIRRLSGWRWLVGLGAAVAAAGAAAVVTMRRYQSATADAKHAADETGQPASADEAGRQQVDGQVSPSGR